MKKYIIRSLTTLLLLIGLVSPIATLPVYAETAKDAVCDGLALTGAGENCETQDGEPTVNSTIQLVINIMSVLVGFAAVLMIIIGGFKYITSSGDSSGINSAKNTILFALVGLVIVAVAQIIVRFVINEATTPVEEKTTMQMVQKTNV